MSRSVMIAVVGLLGAVNALGSVWDEALIAWCAPHDANGDGLFTADKFVNAVGQVMGNVAVNTIIYGNGQEVKRQTVSTMKSASVAIPVGSFRVGENRIAGRCDSSKHASNSWGKLIGNSLWVLQDGGFPKIKSAIFLK